jgi:hypothetical protein
MASRARTNQTASMLKINPCIKQDLRKIRSWFSFNMLALRAKAFVGQHFNKRHSTSSATKTHDGSIKKQQPLS